MVTTVTEILAGLHPLEARRFLAPGEQQGTEEVKSDGGTVILKTFSRKIVKVVYCGRHDCISKQIWEYGRVIPDICTFGEWCHACTDR